MGVPIYSSLRHIITHSAILPQQGLGERHGLCLLLLALASLLPLSLALVSLLHLQEMINAHQEVGEGVCVKGGRGRCLDGGEAGFLEIPALIVNQTIGTDLDQRQDVVIVHFVRITSRRLADRQATPQRNEPSSHVLQLVLHFLWRQMIRDTGVVGEQHQITAAWNRNRVVHLLRHLMKEGQSGFSLVVVAVRLDSDGVHAKKLCVQRVRVFWLAIRDLRINGLHHRIQDGCCLLQLAAIAVGAHHAEKDTKPQFTPETATARPI